MAAKKSRLLLNAELLERTKLANRRSEKLALDLEEAQKLVYPVADLRREQAAAVYAMKSKLLSAPSKLAARVTPMTDIHLVEKEIREVLVECLNELADLGKGEVLPGTVKAAVKEWVSGDSSANN